MALSGTNLCFHALVICGIAVASTAIGHVATSMQFTASEQSKVVICGSFCGLLCLWLLCTVELAAAHSCRILIRSTFSSEARLEDGVVLVVFPNFVVREKRQYGPWSGHAQLPMVGQVLEIDVPEICVPVEQGLYCVKVNTKVIGIVQNYAVRELLENTIPIEQRMNDVIANALRKAVYTKSLEESFAEIQRLFLADAEGISNLISTPAFKVSQLLLDANEQIVPADAPTRSALDIVIQRKQEAGKQSALEASMATEELNVKRNKIALENDRNALLLKQEIFGKEGAAMVEAAKHAKMLYLCVGTPSPPVSIQS